MAKKKKKKDNIVNFKDAKEKKEEPKSVTLNVHDSKITGGPGWNKNKHK